MISVNGVSKLYGMTGFRIGWVVAPRRLVEVMTNIQAQTASCISPVLQAAAEGALTGLQSVTESLRLTIENNRNVLMQELSSFSSLPAARPEGAFYCLPDFRAYSRNSVKLAEFLLREGAGGHGARQRIWLGGAPAAELRRLGQGPDRGRRAHALGVGPRGRQ